jgi:hypothetical protein
MRSFMIYTVTVSLIPHVFTSTWIYSIQEGRLCGEVGQAPILILQVWDSTLHNECHSQLVSTPALYFGGPKFKSQPRN